MGGRRHPARRRISIPTRPSARTIAAPGKQAHMRMGDNFMQIDRLWIASHTVWTRRRRVAVRRLFRVTGPEFRIPARRAASAAAVAVSVSRFGRNLREKTISPTPNSPVGSVRYDVSGRSRPLCPALRRASTRRRYARLASIGQRHGADAGTIPGSRPGRPNAAKITATGRQSRNRVRQRPGPPLWRPRASRQKAR